VATARAQGNQNQAKLAPNVWSSSTLAAF